MRWCLQCTDKAQPCMEDRTGLGRRKGSPCSSPQHAHQQQHSSKVCASACSQPAPVEGMRGAGGGGMNKSIGRKQEYSQHINNARRRAGRVQSLLRTDACPHCTQSAFEAQPCMENCTGLGRRGAAAPLPCMPSSSSAHVKQKLGMFRHADCVTQRPSADL